MPRGKKMTEKQRRFADEYIRLGEITQAAINAGYSTKTAYAIGQENLKKPIIKAYIDNRLEELRKESIAEQDEILQFYTSVMRGEVDEEVLRGVGEGEQTIDRMEVNGANRLKAADALAKRYGLFKDGEVINNIGVTFIDDIGDDDNETN